MTTKIEWTDVTWPVVTGCSPIAAGCRNCYAAKMAARLRNHPRYKGLTKGSRWTSKVRCNADVLDMPLRWKKPRMVFSASMGDLFHKDVPFKFVDQVFAAMMYCPQHTFQVLTKRPERIPEYFAWVDSRRRGYVHERFGYWADQVKWLPDNVEHEAWVKVKRHYHGDKPATSIGDATSWPPIPTNVWLGTSASTQEDFNRNVPHLLKCPAAVRFVSLEPLLEPMTLTRWLPPKNQRDYRFRQVLDWVIIGGESLSSRPGRHCDLEWVEAVLWECIHARVPVFVKQLHIDGKLSKDPAEWPKWARRQEWPVNRGV